MVKRDWMKSRSSFQTLLQSRSQASIETGNKEAFEKDTMIDDPDGIRIKFGALEKEKRQKTPAS